MTPRQEEEYRSNIETYRVLEADMSQPDRTARMLELDNAFHRKSFELCGMEAHYDHMLASLQHVERIRKFSLLTEETSRSAPRTRQFWKHCCTAARTT